MPYYKRRTYNRRPFNKRRKPTRWQTYSRAGIQLYRDVKYLKNLLNVEYKVRDQALSGNADGTAQYTQCVNAIGSGDDKSNRDGRQIRVKYGSLRFVAQQDATITNEEFLRVIVFKDLQNDATGYTTSLLTSNSINAPYNTDEMQRFKVYVDKVYKFNPLESNTKFIKMNFKFGFKTRYNSTSGSSSDISTNGLYIMFVSDALAATPITIDGNFRVRWLDN